MLDSGQAAVSWTAGRDRVAGWGRVVAAAVAVVALVAGAVSPAYADTSNGVASGAGVDATVVVGDFQGGVDVRTGMLSGAVAAGAVTVSWNQSVSASDRYGLGAGWGWGVSFVDVASGMVFPGTGGQYVWDLAGSATGLRDFIGEGARFARVREVLPGREGVPGDGGVDGAARSYEFLLTHTDTGVTEYFSESGDVIAVVDRLGVRVDWVWQPGTRHRLSQIVDGWGSSTRVSYPSGEVRVEAPGSQTLGVAPVTVLSVESANLRQVKDPAGAVTKFGYAAVPGGAGEYLTQLSSGGLVAKVSYTRPAYQASVVGVSRVELTDTTAGTRVVSDRVFDLNPKGDRRNFTGYVHGGSGYVTTGLFGSGADYIYSTSVTDGWVKIIRAYNSNHLMVKETTEVVAGPTRGVVGETTVSYTGQQDAHRPLVRKNLVPNWSKPTTVTHTVFDPASAKKKTSTVSTTYDAFGRVTRTDDGTANTVTEYGANSLPVKTVTTGTDGLVVEELRTLTPDGLRVAESVSRSSAAGGPVEEVSRVTYEYGNSDPVLSGTPTTTTQVGVDGSTLTSHTAHAVADGLLTTTVTDPAGVRTTQVTDIATGLVVSTADDAGRTVTYAYDTAGRQTAVTGPGGLTTKTAYSVRAAGDPINAVGTIRAGGYTTRVIYDVAGRRIATQDNLTAPVTSASDAEPTVTDVTIDSALDFDGWRLLSQTRFGERGLVEQATDQAGRVTKTEYDASGIPVKVTSPDGVVTTAYDAVAGTQTQTLTPHGTSKSISTTTAVDDRGNPVRTQIDYSDGTASVQSNAQYDSRNRATTQTATGTPTSTLTYPAFGEPITTIGDGVDAAPVRAEVSTNGFGQRIQKTLTDGVDTFAAGLLGYDDAGRLAVETDQVGKVWSTQYDPADGAVSGVTRPDGVTVHTLRDGAGRVEHTFLTRPGGTADRAADRVEWVQHEYDPVTGMLTARFDPINRSDTEIGYEYYPDGTPKRTTYPDGTSLRWKWATNGELHQFIDAAGAITTYTYDQATGRLSSVVNHTAGGELIAKVDYSYTDFGQPAIITRHNGAVTQYRYDQAGNVTSETHTDGAGNLITRVEYQRDVAGNLRSQARTTGTGHPDGDGVELRTHEYDHLNRLTATHTHPGVADPMDVAERAVPAETITYRYDLASQLTGTTHTTGPGTTQAVVQVTEFGLDAAGKPTTITRNGVPTPARDYDPNGNLLNTGEGATHTYTPTGLPHTTTQHGHEQTVTVSNTYWVDGTLRTETTQVGDQAPVTLTSYWDTTTPTPTLVTQRDLHGLTSSYLIGLTREHRTLLTRNAASADDQTGAGYYHTNPQSSVLALTNQHGMVTDTYLYTDYGTPRPTPEPVDPVTENPATEDSVTEQLAPPAETRLSAALEPHTDHSATRGPVTAGLHRNPHTYTGGYTTPAGHLRLGNRHYDPVTYTFTTRDTAPTLARYAYAAANPHTHTDPTGTTPSAQTWVGLGLGVAAFIAAIVSIVATAGIATPKVIAWSAVVIFMAAADFALQAVVVTGAHEGYLSQDHLNILEPVSLAVSILAALTGAVAGSYAVQTVSKATRAIQAAATPTIPTPSPVAIPTPSRSSLPMDSVLATDDQGNVMVRELTNLPPGQVTEAITELANTGMGGWSGLATEYVYHVPSGRLAIGLKPRSGGQYKVNGLTVPDATDRSQHEFIALAMGYFNSPSDLVAGMFFLPYKNKAGTRTRLVGNEHSGHYGENWYENTAATAGMNAWYKRNGFAGKVYPYPEKLMYDTVAEDALDKHRRRGY